jgi:molybdopterin converting factor small subunit
MAKIEIWSKDVAEGRIEFLKDPQHLYLIYTDDNGSKEILRGGPEHDQAFGKDELKIVRQAYDSIAYDWNDGSHIGEIIASGSEAEISELWEKMWKRGAEINQEKYDYEIVSQNSNTAVVQMAKAVSLDDEVKVFIKNKSLRTPGDKAELAHSMADKAYDLYEALIDGIEATKENVEQFKKFLQEEGMNPYTWLYLILKALRRPLEELLKSRVKELIQKLLGDIDPLKPVIVLKESKTGRNELFVDQLTGELMDRDGFVSLIESGQYSGYTVASIDGLATPMSKPDKVTSNNLG